MKPKSKSFNCIHLPFFISFVTIELKWNLLWYTVFSVKFPFLSNSKSISLSSYCLKCRSSHRSCSLRKGVFRNFAKFAGKHLCRSVFLNKLAGLRRGVLSFFTEHLWTTAHVSALILSNCWILWLVTSLKFIDGSFLILTWNKNHKKEKMRLPLCKIPGGTTRLL